LSLLYSKSRGAMRKPHDTPANNRYSKSRHRIDLRFSYGSQNHTANSKLRDVVQGL